LIIRGEHRRNEGTKERRNEGTKELEQPQYNYYHYDYKQPPNPTVPDGLCNHFARVGEELGDDVHGAAVVPEGAFHQRHVAHHLALGFAAAPELTLLGVGPVAPQAGEGHRARGLGEHDAARQEAEDEDVQHALGFPRQLQRVLSMAAEAAEAGEERRAREPEPVKSDGRVVEPAQRRLRWVALHFDAEQRGGAGRASGGAGDAPPEQVGPLFLALHHELGQDHRLLGVEALGDPVLGAARRGRVEHELVFRLVEGRRRLHALDSLLIKSC
jgi:hypothetical protein